MAETTINFDCNQLLDSLNKEDFIAENFSISKTRTEKILKNGSSVTVKDTIQLNHLTAPSSASSITITLSQPMDTYETYTSINILCTVELSQQLQDALIAAFEAAGLQEAKFWLSGKDIDGNRYNGDGMPGDWLEGSLDERVEFEDYFYSFERELNADGYSKFYYGLTNNGEINQEIPFDYESSAYNALPYNLEDILPESFGGRDPFQADFGDKLLSGLFNDYEETYITSILVEENIVSDTKAGYQIYFAISYKNTAGEVATQNVSYAVGFSVTDGSAGQARVGVSMSNFADSTFGDTEDGRAACLDFIAKNIFGEYETTEVDVQSEKHQFHTLKFTVLGTALEKRLQVSVLDSGGFSLAMESAMMMGIASK